MKTYVTFQLLLIICNLSDRVGWFHHFFHFHFTFSRFVFVSMSIASTLALTFFETFFNLGSSINDITVLGDNSSETSLIKSVTMAEGVSKNVQICVSSFMDDIFVRFRLNTLQKLYVPMVFKSILKFQKFYGPSLKSFVYKAHDAKLDYYILFIFLQC